MKFVDWGQGHSNKESVILKDTGVQGYTAEHPSPRCAFLLCCPPGTPTTATSIAVPSETLSESSFVGLPTNSPIPIYDFC